MESGMRVTDLMSSTSGDCWAPRIVSASTAPSPQLGNVGGLLEHARASAAFSNPTINGYKRLHGNPLAPNRIVWAHDNKGAMCRLVGGMGDLGTHIENRSGEPTANPYLYMGSQIVAGLDGMANRIDPGGPVSDPYGATEKPPMPNSLNEATDALAASTMFREALGDEFIDHYVSVRRHERTARVTGIQRGIGLNDVVDQASGSRAQRTAKRADNAGRDRVLQAVRITDGYYQLARL